MPEAEGKIFQFEKEETIKTSFLETFEYEGERELVIIETGEFSAVCPFSGLPDIGKIIVHYIPQKRCLELKSFKYYLVSFRNVGIYQEAVTSRIYRDLKEALKTDDISIRVIYNTRGGIDVTTQCGKALAL